MENSIGDQRTMKTDVPVAGDRSLGDARTMRPGGAGPAGRRFAVGELLLGRYRVVGELGQGGMGVVYRCHDETAGIDVALKALPPEVARSSGEMEEVRANFRLVEKLHHPNIANVKTLERDPESGDCYLVMELVDGYDVRQWVRRRREEGRPLTLDEVTIIAYRIAEALDYAHGEGVVHRDIKPSNVRVDFEGNVKVLDFGLAAQISTSQSRVSRAAAQGTGGTAPYMAPEQWRGRRQGAAADQYALAATVYELLEGAPPFEGSDPVILREAVLSDTPAPVAGAPEHVNAALLRALSKEPEARFASCGAFVKALAGNDPERRASGVASRQPEVGDRKPAAGAAAHAETPFEGLGTGRRRGGRKAALWLAGAAGVLAVSLLSFAAVRAHKAGRAADEQAQAAVREVGKLEAEKRAADERAKQAEERTAGLSRDAEAQRSEAAKREADLAAAARLRLSVAAELAQVRKEKPVAASDKLLGTTSTVSALEGDGFVPIFNGHDLTGWIADNDDFRWWLIENGELVTVEVGTGACNLLYDQVYSDFELRFDFALSPRANSGILLRAMSGKDIPPQIQLTDDSDPPFDADKAADRQTGALMKLVAAKRASLQPLGQWNQMEVQMRGFAIRVFINGQETLNASLDRLPAAATDSRLRRTSGQIGFESCRGGVRFRNIRVKELTRADSSVKPADALAQSVVVAPKVLKGFVSSTPPVAGDTFMPLFNGNDLDGWQFRDQDLGKRSWSVKKGNLVNAFTDRNHSTDLMTTDSFKDFTLRYEYRIPARSNSGVYLRGCYEIQICDNSAFPNIAANQKNGAIYKVAEPLSESTCAPNRWHRVEATIKGARLTVMHDGILIHDNILLDKFYTGSGEFNTQATAEGPILLQGALGDVSFRNLTIKQLE